MDVNGDGECRDETLTLTPDPNPNPEPDPDPDPNPGPNHDQAVADYTAPDEELLPVFEALDRNGDGAEIVPRTRVGVRGRFGRRPSSPP